MSIKDIIKKSVVDSFSADISQTQFWVILLFTLAIGAYIFFIYRYVSRDSFYSKDFNRTLVLMALVTTGIVYAMQSNLVISLGMVGALSIVRFRNAVKDPMDLVFLFWSISVGIINGAGLYEVAIELSLVITLAIIVLDFVPSPRAKLILVVNSSETDAQREILEKIQSQTKRYRVKSRNLTSRGVDLIVELGNAKHINEEELLQDISQIKGITSTTVIDQLGEKRF